MFPEIIDHGCEDFPPQYYAGGCWLYCFPNPPCAPGRYCRPCPFPI